MLLVGFTELWVQFNKALGNNFLGDILIFRQVECAPVLVSGFQFIQS